MAETKLAKILTVVRTSLYFVGIVRNYLLAKVAQNLFVFVCKCGTSVCRRTL